MPTPMQKLFDQIHSIPHIPEVVKKLINQVNDPGVDIMAIARNVDKDQMLALKVLRLVNSAFFGLPKKVDSIEGATLIMGLNKLKTLIIACGIVSSVPDLVGFDIKRFWLHSFNTATYAQQLAKEAKLNADIAYTAGLISGLGNVLIHMAYPKEAAEIDQHLRGGKPSYEIEQRRLGFTSFEACAELCRRWHFSDELVTTVANSGNPLAAETPSKLACTVFVARYLSDCSQNDLSLEETVSGLAGDVSTQLGIGEESAADKLQTIMALESNLAGLLD